MKKFVILFVAMAMSIGCSNDDNNLEEIVVKDLVLSMNNKEVYVGDEVLFTVLDKEGEKVDASIYVGNTLVKNPVIFDKVGDFTIVAKKEGFENSNLLKVSVKDKIVELSQLVLSASDVALKIGEQVSFTITANDVIVKDALIYNVATGAALPNNVFEATTAGEFAFVAKKAGYVDSSIIKVEVETVDEKGNYLFVNGNDYGVSMVYFDIDRKLETDKEGNSVEVDVVVELLDGQLANQYSFMVLHEDIYFILTLWGVNKTIVQKDGEIVDYGKRLMPNEVSDLQLSSLVVISDNDNVFELFDTNGEFTINFRDIDVANKGIGVGGDGIGGTIDFEFNFESFKDTVNLNFSGDILFSEILLENKSIVKSKRL